MNCVRSLLDNNGILVCNVEPYLAVKGQKDIRIPLIQPDFDSRGVRQDQGAIGKGKGTDRGEYDRLDRGIYDRTTC